MAHKHQKPNNFFLFGISSGLAQW